VTTPGVDVDAISALLVEVSERVVVPRFRALAEHDVSRKGPGDLVTVADTEAEALITEALRSWFPGVPVIGEEAVAADPRLADGLDRLATYWLLDPLDGTANFVDGNPDFGTMLALVHGGHPVVAWLWLPVREVLVTAELGSGAVADGVRLSAGPAPAPWDTSAATAWVGGRFLPPDVRAVVDARRGDFASVGAGPGSAVAAYAGLVRGVVDVGLQWRTHPWDHAPGSLVLAEAGGAARRPDGRPYRPGDPGEGLVMVAHAEHWAAARDALLGPS
jgi:fructose-1,6-bisphosphatase/inositol monophosphatase family enzyme